MAGPQPGDNQPLLGFRGSGLLDHFGDLIQSFAPRHEAPADSPVVRQLALVRRLHRGDGAILRPGDLDQLLGGAFAPPLT